MAVDLGATGMKQTDTSLEAAEARYAAAVGARLRAVRRQKRLSLQAVEKSSGLEFKASVLGAYERGERTISVPRLQRLAQLYKVPVDQLLPQDESSHAGGQHGTEPSNGNGAPARPPARRRSRSTSSAWRRCAAPSGSCCSATCVGPGPAPGLQRGGAHDPRGGPAADGLDARADPRRPARTPGAARPHPPVPEAPGVYVHVPFCARRCDYCAFATYTDRHHLAADYVDACVAEIERAVEDESLVPAASIFVGGGTPSQLTHRQLARLLGAVARRARRRGHRRVQSRETSTAPCATPWPPPASPGSRSASSRSCRACSTSSAAATTRRPSIEPSRRSGQPGSLPTAWTSSTAPSARPTSTGGRPSMGRARSIPPRPT